MQAISQNFGIYLHVPFCAKNCAYCRFYKERPKLSDIDAYVDGVAREFSFLRSENGGNLPIPETMYWGGGTPALLSESHLSRLAKVFSENMPKFEWTVEVAPSSANISKLKLLKELGVTRVSLGVQSFNEKTLETLGRAHSLDATLKTIDDISKCDFKHFSVDLIFSSTGQSLSDFEADMVSASKLDVDHISAYCLEFESGTSCCAGMGGDADLAKRGREADFMELAMRVLPELGFEQYEISNYAKSGGECLHNLSTWHMAQWLGLGAGAASQWNGRRFRNVASLDKWLVGIKTAKPNYEDIVNLDDDEMFSSALIFGLRMCNGIDLNDLILRYPKANIKGLEEKLLSLEDEGLITRLGKNKSRVKLTLEGRLFADSVAIELL